MTVLVLVPHNAKAQKLKHANEDAYVRVNTQQAEHFKLIMDGGVVPMRNPLKPWNV